MMRKPLLLMIVLLGALVTSPTAHAQKQAPAQGLGISSADLAATFTAERAKVAPSDDNYFWLRGGSVNAAMTLYRGWGLAANFTGSHVSDIGPGVDLNKVTFLAGPRYTYNLRRWTERYVGSQRETRVFGESLFGGVHAFDSVFSTAAGGVKSNANAFAMLVGGGVDITLAHGFGLRAFELDYVRSGLPNRGTDSQSHLHLAFGVSYHFQKK